MPARSACWEHIAIGPDMTAGELHDRMMVLGADLMARALAALERGGLHFTPQPEEGVLYARKIEKAEAKIDWSLPAAEVHNRIRGLSPFRGPGSRWKTGSRVKVLRSTLAAGSGAREPRAGGGRSRHCLRRGGSCGSRISRRPAEQPMGAEAFLRGNPLPAGSRLG